jgi:uncharacterized protein YggL (DUF469 family)
MSRILLNENQTTGAQTWVEFADDQARANVAQNVDDILDAATEERAVTRGERYGDMRKVGMMPAAVVGQAMREGWFYDQAAVRKWLQENPAFLTFERGF